MSHFVHLAQRIFNTPLAISREKAEVILRVLAPRLGIVSVNGAPVAAWDKDGDVLVLDEGGDGTRSAGYDVVEGIAVIDISGTIVHRNGGCVRPYSGMTGCDGIRYNLAAALEDEAVKAIAFVIDSPGGEVAGVADLADRIFSARGKKPLWGILDESAYSAAYWLAAACDRVTVPRTGGTGSIGVVWLHADLSKMLDKEGISVSILTYGARKADGNEFQPLSKEARARFQTAIDACGKLFTSSVARYRGMSTAAVEAQQATTYFGADGVKARLADAVLSPDEAFGALLRTVRKQASA
jgi:signal peptide peptidase SppA